jgi:hypothetical protein
MTPRTPKCEVFSALLLNPKHSGVPEDSKSPTLEVLGLSPTLGQSGVATRFFSPLSKEEVHEKIKKDSTAWQEEERNKIAWNEAAKAAKESATIPSFFVSLLLLPRYRIGLHFRCQSTETIRTAMHCAQLRDRTGPRTVQWAGSRARAADVTVFVIGTYFPRFHTE